MGAVIRTLIIMFAALGVLAAPAPVGAAENPWCVIVQGNVIYCID